MGFWLSHPMMEYVSESIGIFLIFMVLIILMGIRRG